MSVRERVKRYAILVLGIFVISFGVALLTKSNLGTSAISVIPYTLSLLVPRLSYGTWVALFNMLLALLQIVLLRRDTDFLDIVQQLLFAAIFGSVVDLSMFILTYFNPQAYPIRFATLLVSVVVLAFGAYLTLISHVGIMAGDGFARAITKVTDKEFGAVRMASDSTMAVIAAIMNLVAFHALVTVREGTVVSALGAGFVVGFFNKHLTGFEHALLPNRPSEEQQGQGEGNAPAGTLVVTIAREFGSGGHAIGRIVADELGVPFYDSELIAMMAEEGDMDETYVARNDQALRSSALERFYDAYAGSVADEDRSRVRRMFEADERVVRQLAARGSCVIVGRLANWILRDSVPTFDVFVRADERDKARRVARREGISLEQSQRRVEKVDHERSEHCRYCTDTEWGAAENYDIVVNSSVLGVDETAHMLVGMARDMRTQATEGAST